MFKIGSIFLDVSKISEDWQFKYESSVAQLKDISG